MADEINVEGRQPKYTISYINNQPGLVVRFDHAIEGENAIVEVLPIFKKFKNAILGAEQKIENTIQQPKEPVVVPVNPDDGLAATCQLHKVRMFQGTSKTKTDEFGQPKKYWYHRNSQGQMCFGKGFSNE